MVCLLRLLELLSDYYRHRPEVYDAGLQVVQAVKAIPTIKAIDGIDSHNLRSVNTSLLVRVLSRLSELMFGLNVSKNQLHQIVRLGQG